MAQSVHTAGHRARYKPTESLNCTVRWDAERRHASWRGYLAGNDQNRVEEFVSALEEPGLISYAWAREVVGPNHGSCTPGSSTPKPRCIGGFSDATTILTSINEFRLGLFPWTGCSSLGRSGHENDAARCLAVLQGHRHHIDLPPQSGPTVSGTLKGETSQSLHPSGRPCAISGKQVCGFRRRSGSPYRLTVLYGGSNRQAS